MKDDVVFDANVSLWTCVIMISKGSSRCSQRGARLGPSMPTVAT